MNKRMIVIVLSSLLSCAAETICNAEDTKTEAIVDQTSKTTVTSTPMPVEICSELCDDICCEREQQPLIEAKL